MKQFIVFLAIFPFMMAFLVQFALEQNNDYQINMINQAVYNAREEAKTEGGFSAETVSKLKKKLADISGCGAESVKVEVSGDTKYRTNEFDEREMISCRITVPLKNLMALPGLFGIKDKDNQMLYVLENEFPSERLM